MASTTENDAKDDYSFVVNVVLAPHEKEGVKADDKNFNNEVKFQIVVEKGTYGTAAHAARSLIEDSHANIYLCQIVNRKLEESTVGTVAVEFIYGNGYRTFVTRKEGPELKSFRQMGILLSLGDEDEDPSKLPYIMPDDNFWHHVMNKYDPSMGAPTLYIRTSDTLFIHPENTKNQSTIYLNVPTKRGYWTGLTFEGKRDKYPKELPKGVTRKRKTAEESGTKAIDVDHKKAKKDDKEDEEEDVDDEEELEEEEKPKQKTPSKKKTPTKKATPKKADDDDDEEEEEEPKKKDKRKSTSKKGKKEDDETDDEEEGDKKKAKSKRKSTGSTKSKATKSKK